MADIPYSTVKLNDIEVSVDAPITEALFNKLGGSVNYLLDKNLRATDFTMVGANIWQVPADVNLILFEAVAGGGAGGTGGNRNNFNTCAGGGGGGSAESFIDFLAVTPLETLTISIGAGGVGSAGGNTTITVPSTSTVLTLRGGLRGSNGQAINVVLGSGTATGGAGGAAVSVFSAAGGNGGGASRVGSPFSQSATGGLIGKSFVYFIGGAGGAGLAGTGGGGGGGAGSKYGVGGVGASAGSLVGTTPLSYGAGGGGGAGDTSSARRTGAAGAQGFCRIILLSVP